MVETGSLGAGIGDAKIAQSVAIVVFHRTGHALQVFEQLAVVLLPPNGYEAVMFFRQSQGVGTATILNENSSGLNSRSHRI